MIEPPSCVQSTILKSIFLARQPSIRHNILDHSSRKKQNYQVQMKTKAKNCVFIFYLLRFSHFSMSKCLFSQNEGVFFSMFLATKFLILIKLITNKRKSKTYRIKKDWVWPEDDNVSIICIKMFCRKKIVL